MNFNDAVTNMVNGKRLVRPFWNGFYVVVMPNQDYMWTIPNSGDKPVISVSIYVPTIDDIKADDWVIKFN